MSESRPVSDFKSDALPSGWAKTTIGEIAEVRLGRQRSPKNHTGARMRPYLRAANVTWDGLDLSNVKEMNFTEAESATYELQPGDVLVAEASGSPDEVGKPALWRGEIGACCFQNTLIRVRATHVLPEFLRHFIYTEARSGRIGRAAPGVGIHHIGSARLSAWPVSLPPLNEQRRIVTAIEEHLSRLDAADASLTTASRRVEVLGESLDSRLLRGWDLHALADICPVFVDCPHRTPAYTPSGIPALRPRDVVGGKLDLADAARVDRSEFVIQTRRRVPIAGDVLYSRELSFGWAVVVPPTTELCMSQGMVLFRPNDSVNPEFLAVVLNSSIGREQAEASATGSAHPHINLRDIRAYRIPVPPLSEQRRIVAKIEEQLSAIDALRAAIGRAQRRSRSLRRAVLERAFRGELVPQDPADEPAEALLARIRAEREAAPTRRARRRTSK